MALYYFLFSKSAKACVVPGKKTGMDERPFQGPVAWVDATPCFLPAALVDTLMNRFRNRHPPGDVVLLDENELFGPGRFMDEEEPIATVGGDADHDTPLSDYLPELESAEVRAAILADPTLRID